MKAEPLLSEIRVPVWCALSASMAGYSLQMMAQVGTARRPSHHHLSPVGHPPACLEADKWIPNCLTSCEVSELQNQNEDKG